MTNTNMNNMEGCRFGGVLEKRRADGSVAYLARYANPKRPKSRVGRLFDTRARAMAWLDDERVRVDMYRRGLADWTAPKQQDNGRPCSKMAFGIGCALRLIPPLFVL